MKAIIESAPLGVAVAVIQGAVHKRATLPALSQVMFRAENGKIHLFATNLDMDILTSVEAEVETPGSILVSASKLNAIIKELNGEVDIELTDKKRLTLKCGSSNFSLCTMSPDEFPPIQQATGECVVIIDQAELKSALEQTKYAMSKDESRYILNGIFFQAHNDDLKVVSTDGRRLALCTRKVISGPKDNTEFVIPAGAVTELAKLVGEKGTAELRIDDRRVSIVLTSEGGTETKINTKLIEGNYPNYKQVIPTTKKFSILVPCEGFYAAVRAAALMTSEKFNSVKLAFSKNQLSVSANSPEIGESRQDLELKFKGELAIAFNPQYLTESVACVSDDDINIEFTDELSPGLVQTTDHRYLSVIMPMRLEGPATTAPKAKSAAEPGANDPQFDPEAETTQKKRKTKTTATNENKPAEPEPTAAAGEPAAAS